MMKTAYRGVAALAVWLALAPSAVAQDALAAAKDLNASAAYEQTLELLDRLRQGPSTTPVDKTAVALYRAFCLIALGRSEEAQRAIGELVAERPLYEPDETEASPRMRATFRDVRRRMLPSIAQRMYAAAKATFERKDYASAGAQFKEVAAMVEQLGAEAAESQTDLRTLALGFWELSNRASAPPPPPATPPSPEVAAQPRARRLYSNADSTVTPPVPLKEEFPQLPTVLARGLLGRRGVLDLIISENGAVESAIVSSSINRLYDQLLLAATATWRYKPALKDGEPVKYARTIAIDVKDK